MAAAGDAAGRTVADATHELYRQYGKQIYAYCLHQLRSREEAEDAVQTTFLNAFRGLQRGTTTHFEQAWLYKIAQNVCIARRSSSGRRLRVEAPDDFEILEELVPSGASAGDGDTLELMGLDEALDSMPENQRRAILLREWQGLSYREIATELGLTQGAVEMLIFRARRTLAMALEQPDVAERKRGRSKTGFSFGSLIAAMKSLFSGGAVVKMAAVAMSAAVVGTNAIHSIVQPVARTKMHRSAPAPVVHVQSVVPVVARAIVKPRMHLVAYRAHTVAVVRPTVSRWAPSHHAPTVVQDTDTSSAPAASPSSQTSTPAPAGGVAAAPVTHTAAPAASTSGSAGGSSSHGPSVGGTTTSSPSDMPTGTSSAASNAGSGSTGSTTTSSGLDITGTSATHDGHAGGRTTTGTGTDNTGDESGGTSQSGDTSGSGDGTTTTTTPTPPPPPPPPTTSDSGDSGAPPSAPASSPDPSTPPASPSSDGSDNGSAAPDSGAARGGHGNGNGNGHGNGNGNGNGGGHGHHDH